MSGADAVETLAKSTTQFLAAEEKRRAGRRASRKAKQDAAAILQRAQEERETLRETTERQRRSNIATLGAANVEGTGSPLLAILQNAQDSILEEERILSGAKRLATGRLRQGRDDQKALNFSSISNIVAGSAELIAPLLGGGSGSEKKKPGSATGGGIG